MQVQASSLIETPERRRLVEQVLDLLKRLEANVKSYRVDMCLSPGPPYWTLRVPNKDPSKLPFELNSQTLRPVQRSAPYLRSWSIENIAYEWCHDLSFGKLRSGQFFIEYTQADLSTERPIPSPAVLHQWLSSLGPLISSFSFRWNQENEATKFDPWTPGLMKALDENKATVRPEKALFELNRRFDDFDFHVTSAMACPVLLEVRRKEWFSKLAATKQTDTWKGWLLPTCFIRLDNGLHHTYHLCNTLENYLWMQPKIRSSMCSEDGIMVMASVTNQCAYWYQLVDFKVLTGEPYVNHAQQYHNWCKHHQSKLPATETKNKAQVLYLPLDNCMSVPSSNIVYDTVVIDTAEYQPSQHSEDCNRAESLVFLFVEPSLYGFSLTLSKNQTVILATRTTPSELPKQDMANISITGFGRLYVDTRLIHRLKDVTNFSTYSLGSDPPIVSLLDPNFDRETE